jgi:hypothetical protein
MPRGLRRTTGETLIALISAAQAHLRVVAPYIDESGVTVLMDAIVAATMRDIMVEVFEPRQSLKGQAAAALVAQTVKS